MNNNVISNNETKEILFTNQVPLQLHSAQQEINNLRLLNVFLQSTLLRVQTQLIEYIPNKQNETKEKLTLLRQKDDNNRRNIHKQQISFFQLYDNFKNLFDIKQEPITLSKNEKQIDILHEMFHELNTIIHTEHNDRICQLYITLAQTSHSIIKTREGKNKSYL